MSSSAQFTNKQGDFGPLFPTSVEWKTMRRMILALVLLALASPLANRDLGLAAQDRHMEVALLQAAVPEDGLWFLGGLVDEFDVELELIESNNAFAEHVIEVGPPGI